MPIQDLIPVIDNRRFEDIVAEARTRIPRYTPEWTDLNDNDPGMTLVQLFAWMSDMLLYRLGRVPELNYLKFLQLVGIELRPAEPATAEITFPVLPSVTEPFVLIPANTPVAAEVPGQDRPVVFETEQTLIALTARLAAVQVSTGYSFQDVTTINQAAEDRFEPFGTATAENSALLLGFEYSGPFPEVQVNLAVFLEEPSVKGAAVDCGVGSTQVFNSSQLVWEYWNGSSWAALAVLKDETVGFLRTGHIVLKTPVKGKMAKLVVNGSPWLYWIRARVLVSSWDSPPVAIAVRTNTVAARQAESVQDEVIGGANGEPNQVVRLANRPVLAGSLTLEIDEGDGFTRWTEVSDFFGSGKNDLHYVLNRTTGEVRFGNGERGAIPVANVDNPAANIVARAYRFGGGKRGNVAAMAIRTPMLAVTGIAEDETGNLLPASGGRDEETLAQAKDRAPATLKANCRAVTPEDFEELAKHAGNVRRARALPLFHPNFPGTKVPGVVTVIIVPDNDQPAPVPTQGLIRTVCAHLNQRRLLTTEVYVTGPSYHEVEVRANIIAANSADLAVVREAAEESLKLYFSPLAGGDDGLGWPFGGDIFFSRVYQRILEVPGVNRIDSMLIVLDGEEAPECRNVPIPEGELVYSLTHTLDVSYAFEE